MSDRTHQKLMAATTTKVAATATKVAATTTKMVATAIKMVATATKVPSSRARAVFSLRLDAEDLLAGSF